MLAGNKVMPIKELYMPSPVPFFVFIDRHNRIDHFGFGFGKETGYTGKENVPFQAQDFFGLLIFISHNFLPRRYILCCL
jgi:hypothetical protein